MSEEDIPEAVPDFLMLTLRAFAGTGVDVQGDNVVMAFTTNGPSIDVTMTKDQARELAAKLENAAK